MVFYETVRFLGQLSHSLTGCGLCFLSVKNAKKFLFCSSRSVLWDFVLAIRWVLKSGSIRGQREGSSGNVKTADLKLFVELCC